MVTAELLLEGDRRGDLGERWTDRRLLVQLLKQAYRTDLESGPIIERKL